MTRSDQPALTPPACFYIDVERFRRERSALLSTWQLVGSADRLRSPGDYCTTSVGEEPLLFTNDGGTLRGFFNVCRHRAGPVASGCGNARKLACRYHGWTYDLSGQLLAAGEMEDADGFDLKATRLQSVAVKQFGPLLFASESRTRAFDDFFGDLTARCASLGLERMRHVTTREYPVDCNWKVYVDNFLEGYHIPLVHPALNKELDYRQYVTETGVHYVLQYAPVRAETSQYYRSGNSGQSARAWYYWLFPNIMLNIYENQLQTNVVIPVDVERTIVRFDWYAFDPIPDPATDARWQELARFSEQIQEEDATICAAVQRNLHSRAYRPGAYSAKRESGLRYFHSLMRSMESRQERLSRGGAEGAE